MAGMFDTIYSMWLREILRFIKSRSRVVGAGGQPFVWLAIMGVGFGSAFTFAGGSSTSYITFLAPGIIGMTIIFSSIFTGASIIWDKEFGFMKEILVAPVSRVSIVLGKMAGSVTVSMLTAVLVLIVVVAAGIIPLSSLTAIGIVGSLIFMILSAAVFVAIGLIIGALLESFEGFQVIVNFLVNPLFFLSGALFPLSRAPEWMIAASVVDPLTYGVDGIRGALVGVNATPLYIDFLVMLGTAALLIFIADITFQRMQAR